jgi:hypothetical protein
MTGRKLPFQVAKDYLEAALMISGCKEYYGSQSSLLGIAHGLGKKVTVESSDECPDCIFLRSNAAYPNTPDHVLRGWGVQCIYDV